MQVLTGVKNGIIRTRGQWLSHHLENGKTIPVMPTFHPAYLLRTPSQKKLAWADFLEIRNALDQHRLGIPDLPSTVFMRQCTVACMVFPDEMGFSEDNKNTRANDEARTEQHCKRRDFVKNKITAQKA